MNREHVHECWAPASGRWSSWVKPVLFAHIDEDVEAGSVLSTPDWVARDLVEPLAEREQTASVRDTAVIVDLPGDSGAWLGVWLAAFGFRPIPLYNAVMGRGAVIDLNPIVDVLVSGAQRVARAPSDAPPAFLLDAHRLSGEHLLRPGAFDNRSRCWPSDFPSASSLFAAGIRRALLVQEEAARPGFDLEPVLFDWQARGIALWCKFTDEAGPARPFKLKRRFWPIRLLNAALHAFLRRRSDGIYGGLVPEPSGG